MTTTQEIPKVGISVGEAARELGVSESTIYQMFHAGELPFAKRVGHRIILHRQRLIEWLAGEQQHEGP